MPAKGYPLVKARLSPSAQYRRDQARGQLLRRRAGGIRCQARGAATSEAKPDSAAAEPEETARSAEQDGKPPAARHSDAGQQRQVAVVPGVPRYHTDNCILIRFMDDSDVQLMPLKAATDPGCTPCQPGD
jgi:hypothetical protein